MPKLINPHHRPYRTRSVSRTPRPQQGVRHGRHQSSQVQKHWRDSYDYRREYFRKNKGLCGLYFCSQCMKAMFRNDPNLEVDHIYPPSRMSKINRQGTKNTSLLARGLNSTWNCVPICSDCNRNKSDKIGLVTAKGIVAKLISTTRQTIMWVGVRVLKVAWNLSAVMALKLFGKLTSRLSGGQRRSVLRRKKFRGGRRFGR